MNHHALSFPIVLACILLSGCAVSTDLTHLSSPIDSAPNLDEYQKVCQSMTYAPSNYTVEEDTYIYSTRYEFRPMEQSTLKYNYIRYQGKKLILANPDELNQMRDIYPGIPDITEQTQNRADLCRDVSLDYMYNEHPVVSLSQKMNALYQSCPSDQCAQTLAQTFNGSLETLSPNAGQYTFKSQPDTCYLAFIPQNNGIQPGQMLTSETARVQRFRFQYPDISQPIDGLCTTNSEDISIIHHQAPIVIRVTRNEFPIAMASYIDAMMPNADNTESCPNVNRDDEYTFYPAFKPKTFTATFNMTKPHAEPSSNKSATIDCAHPYRWYDYFVHPVPGTLYYYNNTPVIITRHKSVTLLTVISLAGEQFDLSPEQLALQPNGKPTLPSMTSGQCQCPVADETPNAVKSCTSSPKFFDCCDQVIRQSEGNKFKDEMSLKARIYDVCHMDQLKAYEIQTILWTGHDKDYPLRSYFTQQWASQNISPVKDLTKDASILTHTYPIPVNDLMAGKPLSK